MPAAFEFGTVSPRLSPLRLAGVGLVHAGVLAMLLAPAAVPIAAIQPRALTVSLIEPEVETPQPAPRPPSPTPAARIAPQPLLAAKRPTPTSPPAAVTSAPQAEALAETPPASAPPAPEPSPTAALPDPVPPYPPRPADYLANPAPPYPPLSRRQGEQGTVRLNVLINPDGSIARLELAQSSGHPRLDRSAMETVQARWTFEPARQGGKPVAAWVIVPIQFILRS